jgi:uncharacterized tellurite resistance protein B-like protein
MIPGDRIFVICDLLLGAAYADDKFEDAERSRVKEIVGQLLDCDGDLPEDVRSHIEGFDSTSFDVAAAAEDFKSDEPMSKRRLLELVSLVADADDVTDLAEDDYLRALAGHLDADSEIEGLALEYEVEDLRDHLKALRPPPIPKS